VHAVLDEPCQLSVSEFLQLKENIGECIVFFKKEKEVIEQILRHLDLVEDSLKTGIRTIEYYIADNISEAKVLARKVRSEESEADIVRYKIRDKLYSGAYLPLLREDIYKLIESIDKVANAGEACCDFFLNQRPLIPAEMKPHFVAVAQESLGIIDNLKLAVLCYFKGECKIEVVREHTMEIGLQESRVDKLEWDLTKEIFTSSMDFAHQIHLKNCLDHIVEVSDRAEDAGEQLELATLKSMV
jgi:predicted phosphate transport protein (TIGR00153 family)